VNDPSIPPQPPAGIPRPEISSYEQDQGILKALSICYYLMAGLSLLAGLFFTIYIVMGGMMFQPPFSPSPISPTTSSGTPPKKQIPSNEYF
jgi:hypothetical protein